MTATVPDSTYWGQMAAASRAITTNTNSKRRTAGTAPTARQHGGGLSDARWKRQPPFRMTAQRQPRAAAILPRRTRMSSGSWRCAPTG